MPPQMTAIVYGVSCGATTVSMTVGGVDLGSDSINSNCYCNLCQEVEMDSGEGGEIATLQIWEWVVFVNVVLPRVATRTRNLNLTSPNLAEPHLTSSHLTLATNTPNAHNRSGLVGLHVWWLEHRELHIRRKLRVR